MPHSSLEANPRPPPAPVTLCSRELWQSRAREQETAGQLRVAQEHLSELQQRLQQGQHAAEQQRAVDQQRIAQLIHLFQQQQDSAAAAAARWQQDEAERQQRVQQLEATCKEHAERGRLLSRLEEQLAAQALDADEQRQRVAKAEAERSELSQQLEAQKQVGRLVCQIKLARGSLTLCLTDHRWDLPQRMFPFLWVLTLS